MDVAEFWHLLVWPEAENDKLFAEEIARRSRAGLRLIGWSTLALPAVMMLAVWLLTPGVPNPAGTSAIMACVMALGAGALLLERSGVSIAHARRIGWMVALVSAGCLITSAILRAAAEPAILYVVNAQVAVVILIALAALPLKPVHVLALGILTEVFYVAATRLAIWKWGFIEPPSADVNLVFLAMLSVMSTAVAVNSYRRLLETHQSHQAQLRTAEEMRDAQCQVLMSDSAASMGRLAAALSHELNNPLGALRSSVDTLRSLSAREDLPPEKRAGLERRLYETAGGSVDRIHGIVRRIQRYTNLDRAEEMPVDLNPLVSDVAEIVREAMEGKVHFELETEPLPDVRGRPQALSAVFSGLLGDAARAAGDGGGVRVETAARDGSVEVAVSTAAGRWVDGGQEVLEPSFGVRDGRVAACNWSLFGASQMVRRHGGELVIASGGGRDRVVVRLPLTPGGSAASREMRGRRR